MARTLKARQRRKGSLVGPLLQLLAVALVLFTGLFFMKRAFHNMKPMDEGDDDWVDRSGAPAPAKSNDSSDESENSGQDDRSGTVPSADQREESATKLNKDETTEKIRGVVTTKEAQVEVTTEGNPNLASTEPSATISEDEPSEFPSTEVNFPTEALTELLTESSTGVMETSETGPNQSASESAEPEDSDDDLSSVSNQEGEGGWRRKRRNGNRVVRRDPILVGQLDRDRWHQNERVRFFRMPT